MKALIAYVSVHHGNTEKIVKHLAANCEIDLVDITRETAPDLSGYDLIGLASGIYAFRYHPTMLKFAETLPENKRVFLLSTSASDKPFSDQIRKILEEKKADIAGEWHCFGYNTFGPFKLVGGTSKGRPNEEDLANALAFYKGLL